MGENNTFLSKSPNIT